MQSANKEKILSHLHAHSIGFLEHDHQPISTVEEGRLIAASLGSLCCKSLLLKTKKKQYYLVVLESNRRMQSKDIQKVLGCGHLSFASAEEIASLLGSFPGAVSLLCLLFDKDDRVKLVIDSEVLNAREIDCHPAVNDCSLVIAVEDVVNRFLPSINKDFLELKL